jgi:Prion-inhibition and propagation
MEQQRLFAWSETSGLLDLQNANDRKVRESNTFVIHRTTILDLLVQIQCLFQEFEKAQKKNSRLVVVPEAVGSEDEFLQDPAKDASTAHVPLPERRKNFIIKAMRAAMSTAEDNLGEGKRRLRWAAFDKVAFEDLLRRFSTLNDNMTDILDFSLQREILRTTQDTNRGVLQLHKDLSSLHQLVMALDIKMQAHVYPVPAIPQYAPASDASGLRLLAQLAKFKAFNQSLENDGSTPWDNATAVVLSLGHPDAEKANTRIDRSDIILEPVLSGTASSAIRSEAMYRRAENIERVWIEWKEFADHIPGTPSPALDRVQRLASLLHHKPKPDAFRVPHCLGYFCDSGDSESDDDDDKIDTRIGFVFEKPKDEDISPETPPVSLFDLINSSAKPRVTERIRVAHAVANSLLYLHSVK